MPLDSYYAFSRCAMSHLRLLLLITGLIRNVAAIMFIIYNYNFMLLRRCSLTEINNLKYCNLNISNIIININIFKFLNTGFVCLCKKKSPVFYMTEYCYSTF